MGEDVPTLCRLGNAPSCAAVFNDGIEGEGVPRLYRQATRPRVPRSLTTASRGRRPEALSAKRRALVCNGRGQLPERVRDAHSRAGGAEIEAGPPGQPMCARLRSL